MSIAIWFWLIYVLCVIFGVWAEWPADHNYRPFGSRLVLWILLGLIGLRVFGSPIQ